MSPIDAILTLGNWLFFYISFEPWGWWFVIAFCGIGAWWFSGKLVEAGIEPVWFTVYVVNDKDAK